MAGCDSFILEVADDLESQIEKIRSQIENSGGRFLGDTRSGTFSGSVGMLGSFRGEYKIEENVAIVRITQKPFGVTCQSIQTRIKYYLG